MHSMNFLSIKTKTLLKVGFAAGMVLVPGYLFAAGLVPCSGADCDFNDLITLIKNVVDFLIFKLAVPLAAISFAVAGVIILTAGGNESKAEQGKEIAWSVVIGLIIALSAWLVVTAILAGLGATPLGEF